MRKVFVYRMALVTAVLLFFTGCAPRYQVLFNGQTGKYYYTDTEMCELGRPVWNGSDTLECTKNGRATGKVIYPLTDEQARNYQYAAQMQAVQSSRNYDAAIGTLNSVANSMSQTNQANQNTLNSYYMQNTNNMMMQNMMNSQRKGWY